MKKLGIAFIMALLALAFVAAPALAYCPPQDGASAEVTCDEPGVSDENPTVGTTILFYGTVHVNASSYNNKNYSDGYSHYYHSWYQAGAYSYVDGNAYYTIYAPDGTTVVASGGDSWYDFQVGENEHWSYEWPYYFPDEDTSADISKDWYWEILVLLDTTGEYTVEHGGEAYAEYGYWVQLGHYEGHGYNKHFVPDGDPIFYADGDPAYDSCFAQRTVLAHAAASLSTGRTRPILTVLTPVDSELFFTSDGWGSPTSDVIVYNDGTWQVEIADGTIIQLDGEWHRKTWIEVDDQGNVIGRYGSDGHIIAEEIALSSPITVTKVG
jgi:hypothetical protein